MFLHLLALPRVFSPTPLRADSDTAVMLDAIRQAGGLVGVGRWFVGDWLLENGFYRPITSLSLTLDYALYGETAWGYRLTNWLLIGAIVAGTYLLVRLYASRLPSAPFELPEANLLAWLTALALSLQFLGYTQPLVHWSAWWGVGAVLLGVALWNRRVARGASRQDWLWIGLAVGALFWGFERLMDTQYTRLIEWVPSRTALLATALGVWSLYALMQGAEQRRWGWLLTGGGLYLLALGAYEQPVMLVLVVGLLAFGWRAHWQGWGWKVVGIAFSAVVLIAVLRVSLVTTEPTTYQRQQLRSSLSGPIVNIFTELVPPTEQWHYWRVVLPTPEVWLFREPWDRLTALVLYGGVLVAFWQWRGLLGGAWLWHALTFLPMVFLHYFEHYMCLPQVGKTMFDSGLILWGAGIWGKLGHKSAPAPCQSRQNLL